MVIRNKKIHDLVLEALIKHKHLRDSDRALCAHIWLLEAGKSLHLSFNEFLSDFKKGNFTSPETIRRTRQKLQEKYPETRGSRHKERQDDLEPTVREEIQSWDRSDQQSLL